MSIKDLVTNPASGRISTSDTIVVGAFVVASIVLFWLVWRGQLSEMIYTAYIAGFVTQNQMSKRAAIRRDEMERENKPGVES